MALTVTPVKPSVGTMVPFFSSATWSSHNLHHAEYANAKYMHNSPPAAERLSTTPTAGQWCYRMCRTGVVWHSLCASRRPGKTPKQDPYENSGGFEVPLAFPLTDVPRVGRPLAFLGGQKHLDHRL